MDYTRFTEMTRSKQLAISVVALAVVGVSAVGFQFTTGNSSTHRLYAESVTNFTLQAQNSDIVAVGTVESISQPQWEVKELKNGEYRAIYHYVNISISRVMKGKPKSKVTVRVQGGEINGRKDPAPEAPDFFEGEKALLFLEDMGDYYVTKGAKFGKYTVKNGVITRKKVEEGQKRQLSLQEVEKKVSK